jgi:hypothetical protein
VSCVEDRDLRREQYSLDLARDQFAKMIAGLGKVIYRFNKNLICSVDRRRAKFLACIEGGGALLIPRIDESDPVNRVGKDLFHLITLRCTVKIVVMIYRPIRRQFVPFLCGDLITYFSEYLPDRTLVLWLGRMCYPRFHEAENCLFILAI